MAEQPAPQPGAVYIATVIEMILAGLPLPEVARGAASLIGDPSTSTHQSRPEHDDTAPGTGEPPD